MREASSLRLFIALWLPEELKKAALARLDGLRPGSRGVRWVRPEQMHLTLKFLGDTPVEVLPRIQEALAGVAANAHPIDLRLTGGGTFPPSGPPRVLWLGLDPAEALIELAGEVEEALNSLGFPLERRPFRPHLTLGRAETGAVFGREQLAREIGAPSAVVGALSLVRSELGPSGARYTTIHEWGMEGRK